VARLRIAPPRPLASREIPPREEVGGDAARDGVLPSRPSKLPRRRRRDRNPESPRQVPRGLLAGRRWSPRASPAEQGETRARVPTSDRWRRERAAGRSRRGSAARRQRLRKLRRSPSVGVGSWKSAEDARSTCSASARAARLSCSKLASAATRSSGRTCSRNSRAPRGPAPMIALASAAASRGVDDDQPGLLITPAAGRARDRLKADGEPERLGERLRRREQVGVRVAGQQLARRGENSSHGVREGLGQVPT
jgi:hypothetical protein